jgi:hypothetical protein
LFIRRSSCGIMSNLQISNNLSYLQCTSRMHEHARHAVTSGGMVGAMAI